MPRPVRQIFLRRLLCCLLAVAGLFCLAGSALRAEEAVFSYRSRPVPDGVTIDFEEALMRLALDHTVAAEGPYRLQPAPGRATTLRVVQDLRLRTYPGQMVIQTVTPELVRDLAYIRFPVDSGMTGLRVALASAEMAQATADVRTFADLVRFSAVQGLGWRDVGIMQAHGLPVQEISSRESMSLMVARGRADLYWRGVNEVDRDIRLARTGSGVALSVAPGVALYYPLPKFFFAHPADEPALRRLERGLLAAWRDGSFHALWREYFAAALSGVSFAGRRVFVLENPDAAPFLADLQRYELPEVQALRMQGQWIPVRPLNALAGPPGQPPPD